MKIAGLFLVFLTCVWAGFIKAQSYIESRNILRAFISLIYFIKQEVLSYLTPQHEIYEKLYDKYLDRCTFLTELKKSSSDIPLASALLKLKDTLMLKEEVYYLLYEFGTSFGSLSQDEEVRRCEKLIRELEEIYKLQKEETTEKIRLCRTVGCMTGIGLVLLLW